MARLLLTTPEGQQAVELRAHNTLGRHPSNTIQLLDKIVSKEHCVIVQRDGEYVLQVENLLVGDAGHVYRIDVSDTYSGFSLAAEQTQYSSPEAGTFVVKVLAQWRGYDGPMDLTVEGLGEGIKLEGNRLDQRRRKSFWLGFVQLCNQRQLSPYIMVTG